MEAEGPIRARGNSFKSAKPTFGEGSYCFDLRIVAGTISAKKIMVGGHMVNELLRDVGQGAVMLHLQDAELKRPIRGEQAVKP